MSSRRLVQVATLSAFVAASAPFAAAHDMDGPVSFGVPGSAAMVNRTVAITMNDMSFAPNALSLAAGDTVRFVITNRSEIDHEFALGDAKSQAMHRRMMAAMAKNGMAMHHHDANVVAVAAGQTVELIWHFTAAGQYEFDCNVPGHYEAGMKGMITVGPKA